MVKHVFDCFLDSSDAIFGRILFFGERTLLRPLPTEGGEKAHGRLERFQLELEPIRLKSGL